MDKKAENYSEAVKRYYKETVFYSGKMYIEITCLIEDLKEIIKSHLDEFFLLENFGTRQSKGFGGFILKQNNDEQFNKFVQEKLLSKANVFYTTLPERDYNVLLEAAKKIYSELAGETSGKSEKAEAVKIDYLLAYFRGKRSLTSESDFSAELNKSHDEFIGDLLTDPFTLDSMLKRSRLNTRFSLRIGDRADSNKLNLYGNDDETLDEAEKYFICCQNSFERYMAIEQLYLILHPKKDKKKEKYLEFYGETKGKIENLNKAKEKILDKFSPTAVKIYAGIILAAILFIVLTV